MVKLVYLILLVKLVKIVLELSLGLRVSTQLCATGGLPLAVTVVFSITSEQDIFGGHKNLTFSPNGQNSNTYVVRNPTFCWFWVSQLCRGVYSLQVVPSFKKKNRSVQQLFLQFLLFENWSHLKFRCLWQQFRPK